MAARRDSTVRVLGVIPARYASVRLPGKPLVMIAGQPLVQRVYERARLARRLDAVLVATDDERIAAAVRAFGGECVLTRHDHASGTDRIAEVAAMRSEDLFVNVQGDEPLIEPAAIDQLVAAFDGDAAREIAVATLCVRLQNSADALDPHIVKVVRDARDHALYFSRAPIPYSRDQRSPHSAAYFKHLGIYAYRRDALLAYTRLPKGALEAAEQLEQLRFLENGFRVRVLETPFDSVSVDVPEDVPRVEALLRNAQSNRR
jgi:3-deoxy-manno-octulosonate cytidylyltransferase (CMP-KDO synthetase)